LNQHQILFEADLQYIKTYQAWGDKDMIKLIAEANSYNSLAHLLDVSVG
jgi:hypothetical protein